MQKLEKLCSGDARRKRLDCGFAEDKQKACVQRALCSANMDVSMEQNTYFH